ncbi:MAG TPA: hypothetical protein VMM35_04980, partial [Longimicrobiales bacterium]|nr:hypothetical protein [Longimicrobiales bacterium]
MADSAAAVPSGSGDAAATAAGAPPADTTSSAGTLPDSTEWTIGVLTAPPTLDGGPAPVPVVTALRTGV